MIIVNIILLISIIGFAGRGLYVELMSNKAQSKEYLLLIALLSFIGMLWNFIAWAIHLSAT